MTAVRVEVDASALDVDAFMSRADAAARQAMDMAGDLIVAEAKSLAPSSTGELRNSIGHTAPTGSLAGGDLTVTVSASAEHASHVEFGTKPHKIFPRFRRALRFPGSGGGFAFAKVVNHPGTRPQPFLSKAAEQMRGDVVREVAAAIRNAFARRR